MKKNLLISNTLFIVAASIFSTGTIAMQENFEGKNSPNNNHHHSWGIEKNNKQKLNKEIESKDPHELDEKYLEAFNKNNFSKAAKYLTLSAIYGNQDNRDFLYKIDKDVGKYLLKHQSEESINYYENILSEKIIEYMKNY
jgi:hypothetical protein